MAGTFPTSVDVFKTIPTPSTTPTSLSDASDDPLSVRLQQHSTALVAVETYVLSHKGAPFNIIDFGADPTAATDSTAAINNAIAAMLAARSTGGSLYFPAGTYLVSSVITLSASGTYFGDGNDSTSIVTTSATADIFLINNSGITIRDMVFSSTVTRTAGFFINTPGGAGPSNIYIRSFQMIGAYFGIRVNWTLGAIRDGYIVSFVSTAIDIIASLGVTIDNVSITGISQAAPSFAGILINGTGGMFITNCETLYVTSGLLVVNNIASTTIFALYVLNCFFDTGGDGLSIQATASGSLVERLKFTNCWSASNSARGALLLTSGGGKIDGVEFVNCSFFNNAAQGILVNDSGSKNVRIMNSSVCGNGVGSTSDGIYLASGVTDFSIISNRIGNGFGFAGNTDYAINFAGSNTNCVVTNNDMRGNTVGELNNAPATGAAVVIANNI